MGNIRILEDSLELQNIEKPERDKAVFDYFIMKGEAEKSNDRFWAFESLYTRQYSYGNYIQDFIYADWKHIRSTSPLCDICQRTIQLIQTTSRYNRTATLKNLEEFEQKSGPRSGAGFKTDSIKEDYIFDISCWKKWHYNWLKDNPQYINWDKGNDLFCNIQINIAILGKELEKKKQEGLPSLADITVSDIQNCEIINHFHDSVMKRLSDVERIAYTKEIGKKICEANYYQYEESLSKIEEQKQRQRYNNDTIRVIYSITKGGKQQFISLDTRHGMLEFHDEDGNHLGEFRFDGTLNSSAERSHN